MSAANPGGPVQGFRQIVATIMLLAYCVPIIAWTVYGAIHLSPLEWQLEDDGILGAVSYFADNSTGTLNLLRQILLPLLAALTASLLVHNAHTRILFGVLVVVSTLALLSALVGTFLFAPDHWEKAATNRAFFSDLASSLAVYVMLLVGLKL
ncbi:hypothetical protein MWN33_17600 [Starkeya koreensis]|uniref:Uncharacterized protein n=1 Tax=Ancylobacter koreensis TaxID=266121 RepID=A0ABT0DRF0_9HYPH|nr:hypothetical protein [Ancylobacter koreensis]MCK0209850.1 hypothetical protein [Ancylobacter koreensis]